MFGIVDIEASLKAMLSAIRRAVSCLSVLNPPRLPTTWLATLIAVRTRLTVCLHHLQRPLRHTDLPHLSLMLNGHCHSNQLLLLRSALNGLVCVNHYTCSTIVLHRTSQAGHSDCRAVPQVPSTIRHRHPKLSLVCRVIDLTANPKPFCRLPSVSILRSIAPVILLGHIACCRRCRCVSRCRCRCLTDLLRGDRMDST